MPPIRVLIADDQDIVRTGLKMMLMAEEDIVIIGEASNGHEAVQLARELAPDVVVMDVAMPDLNGIEATRQLGELCPKCAVVALTIHEDQQYFFQMLHAGALGYVPKRAAPDDLVRAIRAASEGHVFLFSSVASLLASDVLSRIESGEGELNKDVLTEREREVLVMIAEGMMNREIAERLTISVKTVERHRENIMNKLNLHSRTELVKYAIRKGFIDLK
ncbi:MAG: response regulator transcription factor [Chloroflexota bacterium]|jgi:two-component system, NarL family, response regulator NreC